MAYKATRDIDFNHRAYKKGDPIAFGEGDGGAREQLLACGAIDAGAAAKPASPGPDPLDHDGDGRKGGSKPKGARAAKAAAAAKA